jgi:hypothetical protein
MYDAVQTSICPKCGSTETDSLFCNRCGETLRPVAPLVPSGGPDVERRWTFWGFSKKDLIILLLAYVGFVLCLHFNILHYGSWYTHPIPIQRAAWEALISDMVFAVILKLKFGNEYWK